MEQNNINHSTESFKQLLGSTARLAPEVQHQLEDMIFSFPQCGLLRALQAQSSGDARWLNEAAAWFSDSVTLQKIVKQPQGLPVVNPAQVIITQSVSKGQPVPSSVTDKSTGAAEQQSYQQPQTVIPTPETAAYYEVLDNEEGYVKPQIPVPEPIDEKVERSLFKQEQVDHTQQLIIENIAANDYFVFDKAFTGHSNIEPEVVIKPEPVSPAPVKPAQKVAQPAAEEGGITRYHDDKMPYSFMWWLDKTRNKHSGVYQPFAHPAPAQPAPESFVEDVIEERPKENDLVERFIQEDPQIKPQDGSKLDNENKGRQSEQDHEELITETLARIYSDQMLYSKAIAAYKILMLKNPEKRRYFASQIENLQKKIN